jgi:hypothetical protein
MGVYHFMGLGRSIGAVTAPVSYLAARFERDNETDRAFFGGSGEIEQPADQKRGDVQAFVLFTTPEVRLGMPGAGAESYVLNSPGFTKGQKIAGQTVQQALRKLLADDVRILTQASRNPKEPRQRKSVELYWCDVKRDDPTLTFERVAKVLTAVKSVGGLGKEVWINLTGGSNIINSALQLAVSLLGVSARLYYILTNHTACVRHTVPTKELGTIKDTFWVDLPIIYSTFQEQHRHLLEELAGVPEGVLSVSELCNRAQGWPGFGPLVGDTYKERLQSFNRSYLLPLLAQGLVTRDGDSISIGPNWSLLRRYYHAVPDPSGGKLTPRQLAEGKEWFFQDKLVIGER